MCGSCAYVRSGSPAVCFTCASRHPSQIPSARCSLCSQEVERPGASCSNTICSWPQRERWYGRVSAIARDAGPIRRVIRQYKYGGVTAWAQILARVIVGYLDEHAEEFGAYDSIIPMPAFTGPSARRSWAQIDLIVQRAATEDPFFWPFRRDGEVIAKIAETDSMSGKGWSRRHQIAVGQLRAALQVPDRSRVAGQRVLVVDDVFTTGHDMLEVARALRLAGGAAVDGLVLARAQWRQRV